MFKIRGKDDSNQSWAAQQCGKVAIIKCGSKQIDDLKNALDIYNDEGNSNVISEEEKTICSNLFSLKHEISHVRSQDVKKSMFACALVPFAVQAVCSTMNYGAKKLSKYGS